MGTAVSVGTPGASLPQQLGPGYTTRARATLDAIEFDKEPEAQEFKLVGDRQLKWDWSVSSKTTGKHLVLLAIDVEWTRTAGPTEVIQERVWSAAMEVEITKPFISLGQLQLATLLTGFISSGLTVPFLYGLLKERRSRHATQPEDSSSVDE